MPLMLSTYRLLICTVLLTIIGYSCQQHDDYIEPRFDDRPLNITAIAGETISLPCAVEYKKNYSIAWMNPNKILISQGDRRLMDDIRMTIERPLIPDWNLHIRNVRYSDRGMYSCTLNTKPVLIKRINLTVLVPPDINEYWSSSNQVVKEGSTVQLICNATGMPLPEITWFRKSVYNPIEKKDALGSPGEILVIHNITRYCDGIYECVASNGVGDVVSKEINVEVQFPPEVRLLTKKISQRIGKETILTCMISASPQAVGIWLLQGKPIEASWKIRTEVYEESPHTVSLNLRIMNLEDTDFGFYTCEASNRLGGDSERMLLYEEKPKITTATALITEETITVPVPIHNHIKNGRHRQNMTKSSKTGYNIPKDPVYQYAGGNGCLQTLFSVFTIIGSLAIVIMTPL